MFRHVVLLTFVEDAPEGAVDDVVRRLRELPAAIPELRSYVVGADAGLAAGNADVVVVADFDDVAGYEVYRDHPQHRAVIETAILPILASRTAAQHPVAADT